MGNGIIIGTGVGVGLLVGEDDPRTAPTAAELAGYSVAERTAAALAEQAARPRRWRWPMPLGPGGLRPSVSDPLHPTAVAPRKNTHNGVDICYWSGKDKLLEYKPPERSGGGAFICPAGTEILAAADGVIWSVATYSKGIQVVIDHGMPWCTYYTHLTTCRHPMRKGVKGGAIVKAGDVLGTVGNDRSSRTAFNHLHFEVWFRGAASAFIDPEPILKLATHN